MMHLDPVGWLLRCFLLISLLGFVPAAQAQQAARVLVSGQVRDAAGQPLPEVSVGVEGQPGAVSTDAGGRFRLSVARPPAGAPAPVLVVRSLGYQPLRQPLDLIGNQPLTLTLQTDSRAIGNVTVRGRRAEAADAREQVSLTPIDPRDVKTLPSPFGDFNKILTTLPGVVANNELTSTYSVRGGNYEENLVYVNGFEVYRPFLVTSAQQEGLSFINPDLVESVEFSTGGWQPKYGDKLSSVLSAQYKTPQRFAASASASLVGGTAHVEATSPNKRVSYLVGVRYKNARYVLRSLRQQQGGYNPTFYDAQAYINANLGPAGDEARTSLGLLTTLAHNDFRFTPESGVSTFNTAGNQLTRLTIYYDGRERMQYDTYQGGLNLRHRFTDRLRGELLAGALLSRELEYRDVEASYLFSEVNNDPKSPDFNRPVRQRDAGSRFNHSRNNLTAKVFTLEARGSWQPGPHSVVRAGVKTGRERIHDTLDEYSFIDSADYVPDYRRTRLVSDLQLDSYRTQGYVQQTIDLDSLQTLTYGVRAHYWSVNRQLVVSPRVQYSLIPRRHPHVSYKLGVGVYYQPPFYRELRNQANSQRTPQDPVLIQAQLNPELRAQKSLHFIAGTEIRFQHFGRPFRFSGEAYYKYLTDVVPYDVDNLRLRYFGLNNARAYAAGLDARLSGEFVRGAESWFSLGVLTTRENIAGDSMTTYDASGQATGRVEKGYLRRPTDQRLNVGVFFQDHLPDNPSVKGYVNLVFGTGLPFSPPYDPDNRGTSNLVRSYKRVDLGFSKVVALRDDAASAARHPGQLQSLWIGLEILNILQANNVAGYSYVQDINGRTYAVPNYLSQRVVNLRVLARF